MSDLAAFFDTWIREHAREAEGFLAELVRMPSDNPPGDTLPIAERAAALLEGLGLTVERHAVPETLVRAHGMVRATNLIVRARFDGVPGDKGSASSAGPVVALNAHGDVVPPGEGWSVPPYSAEIRDGQMYGRGVAVSKSDFATYTFALLALRAAAADPGLKAAGGFRGTVELHFTFDEEAGGEVGPAWLLAQGLTRPDFAICAGFSFDVVIAHNGCLHLEVEVAGRSAHAARPHEGHDALEAASRLLGKLYDHRRKLADISSSTPGITHPTLVVGTIEGGINTNVVPDRIRFRLDRRMVPEENPATVERELTAFLTGALAEPGISVSVRRLLLAEPLRATDGSRKLGALIAGHARAVLGEEIPLHGVPLYTDARHYAAAGVPVVLYGAGPKVASESGAHGPDERLRLEHLHAATRVVARTLADLLMGKA